MKQETKQNLAIATLVIVVFSFFGTLAFRKTEPINQVEKPKVDTLVTDIYKPKIDSSKYYQDSIQIIKKYTSEPNSAGGVDLNIIKKSGSWFSYGETKLGQGRDAVKNLIGDNPELMEELEAKIKDSLTKTDVNELLIGDEE